MPTDLVFLAASLLTAAPPIATPAMAEVVVASPIWNETCAARYASCVAQLPVLVRNRSSAPLFLTSLALIHPPPDVAVYSRHTVLVPDGDRVIPPGATVRYGFSGVRDSLDRFVVRAVLSTAGWPGFALASDAFVLTNPARAAVESACRAGRGDWGPHGIAQRPSCIERAPDGGKPCRDGNDCAASCRFDRWEPVSIGFNPMDAFARFVTMARPVGRCTEWMSGLGCRSYIPRGASREPPTRLPAPAPGFVCAD